MYGLLCTVFSPEAREGRGLLEEVGPDSRKRRSSRQSGRTSAKHSLAQPTMNAYHIPFLLSTSMYMCRLWHTRRTVPHTLWTCTGDMHAQSVVRATPNRSFRKFELFSHICAHCSMRHICFHFRLVAQVSWSRRGPLTAATFLSIHTQSLCLGYLPCIDRTHSVIHV